MVALLREVLVKRPGSAFARAFEDPANGFLHPVDLAEAQRQHDALTQTLTDLGVMVHELGTEADSPDLTYVFDPALVSSSGAILLRPGKRNRLEEPAALREWFGDNGIPIAGVVDPPGAKRRDVALQSVKRYPRTIGRVRQVGPPLPLMPISVAGKV